jgi:competence protein ComEC
MPTGPCRAVKLFATAWAFAVVAAVLLCGAVQAAGTSELAPGSVGWQGAGWLRVDFVSVGHGDAVLITSPVGKTVLIDGGLAEAGDTVADYVRSRTHTPIDLVLLTHRHADHLGGLAKVITRQGARSFMDAAFPHPSPAYDALIRVLEERHIPLREARRGRTIDLGGDTRLILLTPPEPLINGSRSDPNANSIVTRLEFGQVRMLLTGDAEAVTEAWLLDSKTDVRADVLKLAHHGSRYSSTSRFLQAVTPRVVIASCSAGNEPGHIHPDTLTRVGNTGARLYRTDVDGNITVWSDGRDVRVEAQKRRWDRGQEETR